MSVENHIHICHITTKKMDGKQHGHFAISTSFSVKEQSAKKLLGVVFPFQTRQPKLKMQQDEAGHRILITRHFWQHDNTNADWKRQR